MKSDELSNGKAEESAGEAPVHYEAPTIVDLGIAAEATAATGSLHFP
jgi:hypothetical protein